MSRSAVQSGLDRTDLPGATYCPPCASSAWVGHVPPKVACDASPVESRADFGRREGFGAAYARVNSKPMLGPMN
jgi:hypothetical protein